jgi:hypothetical protein
MEGGPICLKCLQCFIAMVTPAARFAGIFAREIDLVRGFPKREFRLSLLMLPPWIAGQNAAKFKPDDALLAFPGFALIKIKCGANPPQINSQSTFLRLAPHFTVLDIWSGFGINGYRELQTISHTASYLECNNYRGIETFGSRISRQQRFRTVEDTPKDEPLSHFVHKFLVKNVNRFEWAAGTGLPMTVRG